MEKNYMALDQYGTTEHDLGEHPRKTLMERYSVKSAQKMYMDSKVYGTLHVGWIVSGHWFTVYAVSRMENREASANMYAINGEELS